ncbi:apolipoprotein N-acyltransferase [Boudabousia liubingyangii]|nr:apolipoprotein N-acyltransferase [Boudabousia liubingyangii]
MVRNLKQSKAKGKKQRDANWSLGLISTLVSILAGLIMWGAQSPWGFEPLFLIGLTLLVGVFYSASLKRATLMGFVAGVSYFAPLIYWSSVSIGSLIPWFVLVAIQSAWWALLGFLTASSARLPRSVRPLLFASLWTGIELIRGLWPLSGFPWGTTAQASVGGIFGGLLPYGGEVLLSFSVALVAAYCLSGLAVLPRLHLSPLPTAAAFAVLLLIGVSSFLFAPHQRFPLGNDQQLTLGLVQGGVPLPPEESYAEPGKISGNHIRTLESGRAAQGEVQVFLAGETALDRDPRKHFEIAQPLSALNLKVPFIYGVNQYFVAPDSKLWRHNQVTGWQGEYPLKLSYDKQIPVPFGEYIPFKKFLNYFVETDKLLPTEVVPGAGPAVLTIPLAKDPVTAGIGICFEVAFEQHMMRGIREGGTFIYVPTNNSSFGKTYEAYQQFQLLRVRARESDRWAVGVSTNGISGVVTPQGAVSQVTKLNESAYLKATIGLRKTLTPAVKYAPEIQVIGLILGSIAAIVALGLDVFGYKKRPRRP